MSYILFEVWEEDEIGHQELIETTASEKEARDIAQELLGQGALAVVIYKDTDGIDTVEFARIEAG